MRHGSWPIIVPFLLLVGGCGSASEGGLRAPSDAATSVEAEGAPEDEDATAAQEPPSFLETDNLLPFEGRLTESPFSGPANSGMIGLGSGWPWGLFSPEGRDRYYPDATLAAEPTSVLAPTLVWLAARQAKDGGWADGLPDGAAVSNDPGLTGRVLLAFLGGGYTNRGPHDLAGVVARGIRYLKTRQDEAGWFVARHPYGLAHDLRTHVPACAALVEIYAQTRSPVFKSSAQRAVAALQAAAEAWDSDLGDPEVAQSALLALLSASHVNRHAAQDDRPAPFVVTAEAFAPLARLRSPAPGADDVDLALAVLARAAFEDVSTPEAQEVLRQFTWTLARHAPDWDALDPRTAPGTWTVLHTAQEIAPTERTEQWREETRQLLFARQSGPADGAFFRGSWDPAFLPDYREGRIRLTAQCLATLWKLRSP